MAYVGFAKLKSKLAGRPGVKDPGAVAASIGRKKYGKKKMSEMSAKHKIAPEMGYAKLPEHKVSSIAKRLAGK